MTDFLAFTSINFVSQANRLYRYLNVLTHLFLLHQKRSMDMDTNDWVLVELDIPVPCQVCQDHSSGKHYGIFRYQ
jgi:hypothetical protein